MDFAKPGSSNYRIRFLFEEDYYRLHISGDLGELIATNFNNMCYEEFNDFVHNTGYFEGKIDCNSRPIYEYDYDKTRQDLEEHLKDYEISKYELEKEEEAKQDKIDEIMNDFVNDRVGLGGIAYSLLSEIDSYCFDYFDDLGKQSTGILDLYMLAFELAQEQLKRN